MSTASLPRRVPVWSARLRLLHWLFALAALVLLASGWLGTHSTALSAAALDYHYLAGYVLALGLGLRVYLLLFGTRAEHWRDCWPDSAAARAAARATLRLYLSGGRAGGPQWFAHNPLWGPVYLLLLPALAAGVGSGWWALRGSPTALAWHSGLATGVAMFALLHLLAVVIHDLRGEHGEVSAMINGHKWFRSQAPAPEEPAMRDRPVAGPRRDRV